MELVKQTYLYNEISFVFLTIVHILKYQSFIFVPKLLGEAELQIHVKT